MSEQKWGVWCVTRGWCHHAIGNEKQYDLTFDSEDEARSAMVSWKDGCPGYRYEVRPYHEANGPDAFTTDHETTAERVLGSVTVTDVLGWAKQEPLTMKVSSPYLSFLFDGPKPCVHFYPIGGGNCMKCGCYVTEHNSTYDADRMRLADEAGRLKSELDDALRENATLRQRVERLERKR